MSQSLQAIHCFILNAVQTVFNGLHLHLIDRAHLVVIEHGVAVDLVFHFVVQVNQLLYCRQLFVEFLLFFLTLLNDRGYLGLNLVPFLISSICHIDHLIDLVSFLGQLSFKLAIKFFKNNFFLAQVIDFNPQLLVLADGVVELLVGLFQSVFKDFYLFLLNLGLVDDIGVFLDCGGLPHSTRSRFSFLVQYLLLGLGHFLLQLFLNLYFLVNFILQSLQLCFPLCLRRPRRCPTCLSLNLVQLNHILAKSLVFVFKSLNNTSLSF